MKELSPPVEKPSVAPFLYGLLAAATVMVLAAVAGANGWPEYLVRGLVGLYVLVWIVTLVIWLRLAVRIFRYRREKRRRS
ncbi:hypothetical protein [Lysobacter sp. A3-1-A15]|uniref:hypothetical protein n=1 Tax=Novilysobacter viscosus TaxID=3098602 RepID=UPI002EDAEF83